MAGSVVQEMARRGIATGVDFRALTWNQDRVREILQPFKEVALAAQGNRRKSYTKAGGRKIGRSKDDPDRMWIDTYSAIKTPKINAVFVCYIKQPGEDPEFQLHIDGICTQSYNADRLGDALTEWRNIAMRAVS